MPHPTDVMKQLVWMGCFEHSSYFSNLRTSDYHQLTSLKMHLGGESFPTYSELKGEVDKGVKELVELFQEDIKN